MIKLTEWDLQRDPRPNGRGCLEGLAPSHQKQTSGEGESTSNLVLKQKKYCKFGFKITHRFHIISDQASFALQPQKDRVFEPPAQGCWHAARD